MPNRSLTTKESLALLAILQRIGFAGVIDELAIRASEYEDEAWQGVSARLADVALALGEVE